MNLTQYQQDTLLDSFIRQLVSDRHLCTKFDYPQGWEDDLLEYYRSNLLCAIDDLPEPETLSQWEVSRESDRAAFDAERVMDR